MVLRQSVFYPHVPKKGSPGYSHSRDLREVPKPGPQLIQVPHDSSVWMSLKRSGTRDWCSLLERDERSGTRDWYSLLAERALAQHM